MAEYPPIRVSAMSAADAVCLFEALQLLRGEVARSDSIVDFVPHGDRDQAIVDVLDVTRSCIDEHGVGFASIEFDGRTYALRAATEAPAA